MPEPEQRLLKPGSKAPDFELASSDGKPIKLSDYRARSFGFTSGGPADRPAARRCVISKTCIRKYKDKGLVILGLNASDDKKIALELMRENGATFPNILDSSEAAEKVSFQDYRGSGVPLNYIIDREGKIVDAWYGYETGHRRAKAALEKMGIKQ